MADSDDADRPLLGDDHDAGHGQDAGVDFSSVRSFEGFRPAARAVLAHLQDRHPFGIWMVTRASGEEWIILESQDISYGMSPGDVLRWSDTFCSRMVAGLGPRIAPVVSEHITYATAPVSATMDIKAYVGVPLEQADGTLFGTLCAIDVKEHSQNLLEAGPEIELYARLLSTIIDADLKQAELAYRAELAEAQATTDVLTGLPNRRAWESLSAKAEAHCAEFAAPAHVISIDLDGLKGINDTLGHPRGDDLIRRAASAIAASVRSVDFAARVGGDEFAVLLVGSTREDLETVTSRLASTLVAEGIDASIGTGSRRESIEQAWSEADQAMYVTKRNRHSIRP